MCTLLSERDSKTRVKESERRGRRSTDSYTFSPTVGNATAVVVVAVAVAVAAAVVIYEFCDVSANFSM